jgi:hypothetical protein
MALPAVIQEIVRLIGHEAAMALVREFGGREWRIPKGEGGALWAALVEVIGEPATRVLCRAFGGEPLYVAFCDQALRRDRNRRLIERYDALLGDGHSSRGAVSVLVGEFRICYRMIEKIVNAPLPAAEPVQGGLF